MTTGSTSLKKVNSLKFAGLAAVALYAFWYSSTPTDDHVIDQVDALLGHFGGSLTQCLGPIFLIGFFCWRKNFFYAALAGFWLGVNLLNISLTAEDTLRLQISFLTGALLHGAGMAVLTLSTVAGIVFTREATALPAPSMPDPVAFGDEWLKQGRPAPAGTAVYHNRGSGSNWGTVLIFAAIGGAFALYTHGAEWLQTLTGSAAVGSASPWPSDFAKALAQAQAEHKPILLDFTGSDWCSACHQLDDAVLNTQAFRDYAEKNVIVVEVDMPHNKSQPAALKQQNEQLCAKYNIEGFPTVIVLNSQGKTIGTMVGGPPDDQVAQYTAALKDFITRAAAN